MVVTSAGTARLFVAGVARYLASEGHQVYVIASGLGSLFDDESVSTVHCVPVHMDRAPQPFSDLRSLISLIRVIRKLKPEVLTYATPKASLLASIAGRSARVPRRVYQLWGLRLETVRGPMRHLLSASERITSWCSSVVLANSRSLAGVYVSMRLNARVPVRVLGNGSSHGVDLARFSREARTELVDEATSRFLRSHPGLVVGFVGRVHPDKGVDTLLAAAETCRSRGVALSLVIVGRDEGFDWGDYPSTVPMRRVGSVSDPRAYLKSMDILVLVSRREGFPNAVLEAAAMGVPAIVSDATGAVDAVVDGITGVTVPVGDAEMLTSAIIRLAADPATRKAMGSAARRHAEQWFDQQDVWKRYSEFLLTESHS